MKTKAQNILLEGELLLLGLFLAILFLIRPTKRTTKTTREYMETQKKGDSS